MAFSVISPLTRRARATPDQEQRRTFDCVLDLTSRIYASVTSHLRSSTLTLQLSLLPRHQKHFRRRPPHRPLIKPIVSLLNHEPCVGAQLRQTSRRVEPQPVLACSSLRPLTPGGVNSEHTRERIKLALLGEQGSVRRCPPVALEKSRHHPIPAAAVPYEDSARLQNAGEFPDYSGIVRGVREESERGEEIEHGVETARPPRRQVAHVAACVAKSCARPALASDVEKLLRVVEPVDIVAELSQQVRMPTLTAGYIQKTRAIWQCKQIDEPRYLLSIAREREKQAVLPEIVGVECRLPPLARLLQKKTGSR